MFERFQTVRSAPMKDFTTLRLGGPADWLITPRSALELKEILSEAGDNALPVTVIGQGSNLLVLDGGIRGAVVRMARGLTGCSVLENRIVAEAGTMMSSVAAAAAEAGLTGLEFASGIPGTVGGGVLMNAGAYGGEMSQIVQQVTVLGHDGQSTVLKSDELSFGYRYSALQGREMIVTQVVFQLSKGDKREIRERMNDLNEMSKKDRILMGTYEATIRRCMRLRESTTRRPARTVGDKR